MHAFTFTSQELSDLSTTKAAVASQYQGERMGGPLHLEVRGTGYAVAADVPVQLIEKAMVSGGVFRARGQVMSARVGAAGLDAVGAAIVVQVVPYRPEDVAADQWAAMVQVAEKAV